MIACDVACPRPAAGYHHAAALLASKEALTGHQVLPSTRCLPRRTHCAHKGRAVVGARPNTALCSRCCRVQLPHTRDRRWGRSDILDALLNVYRTANVDTYRPMLDYCLRKVRHVAPRQQPSNQTSRLT